MKIETKFDIGQTVYTYNKYNDKVYELHITTIHIERYETRNYNSIVYGAKRKHDNFYTGYLEDDLFATREEAERKLKEMQ